MRGAIALSMTFALFAAGAGAAEIKAAVLRVERERPLPLSRLDLPAGDEGFAGARVATADNATTGRFLGQTYETVEVTVAEADIGARLDALVAEGVSVVVTLADADATLAAADHLAGTDVLVINADAADDRLRGADCRANLFHVSPSRAMLADGLAQYLVWKRWTDWVIVHGSHPRDVAKGEAFARAAQKFGARVVETRVFEDAGGARRTDSGHVLVQRQIPVFMQNLPEHHVVVVADESEVFGAYIPYRAWDARPVAGDAGLIASNWDASFEGFGATQMQRRFEKAAGRAMTDLDYNVWAALRAVGEAVTRTASDDPAVLRDFMRGDTFELAAFKGQPLTFRAWNNQLRQAVILADGKLVVTLSPQEEFLHQRTRLDTLGYDEPESACRF